MRRLTPAVAAAVRQDLRTASAEFAAGRASLASVHHRIERIAKHLTHPKATLGEAKCCMRSLVRDKAPHMLEETGLPGWNFTDLYDSVTDARNDLAHTGTAAALADTRTAALVYVLIEALMTPSKSTTAGKIMVSNPVCAQGWQTLADVRRTMLMHDYSTLPFKQDGGDGNRERWMLLHAKDLGEHLLDDRDKRIGELLGESNIRLRTAQTACLSTLIEGFFDKVPILVTDSGSDDGDLLGIITAFDLL